MKDILRTRLMAESKAIPAIVLSPPDNSSLSPINFFFLGTGTYIIPPL